MGGHPGHSRHYPSGTLRDSCGTDPAIPRKTSCRADNGPSKTARLAPALLGLPLPHAPADAPSMPRPETAVVRAAIHRRWLRPSRRSLGHLRLCGLNAAEPRNILPTPFGTAPVHAAQQGPLAFGFWSVPGLGAPSGQALTSLPRPVPPCVTDIWAEPLALAALPRQAPQSGIAAICTSQHIPVIDIGGVWHKASMVSSGSLWRRLLASRPCTFCYDRHPHYGGHLHCCGHPPAWGAIRNATSIGGGVPHQSPPPYPPWGLMANG